MIKIINISKIYKNETVLKDISLDLEEGLIYGFSGYNGSGKSLLFKIICGFTKPTSGDIIIDSKYIGKDIEFIEDAGILIESPDFLGNLTAFQNLHILSKINNKISNYEIKKALLRVGLDPENKLKVSKYSLGMKQRLRIAQAIMEDNSILILDEPMNGLDKEGVKLVNTIIKEENKKGKTILITNHINNDLNTLYDKVYNLEDGNIKSTCI